jgi:uncharacterized protein (TIGR03067 family)
MKRVSAVVGVFFLMFSTTLAQDDAAKKDLDRLQGVWQVVSMEIDGKVAPADEFKGLNLTFKGNKASQLINGKNEEASIKLDPSKKPKAIDMTPLIGPDKGMTIVGIYSIEGDNLRICIAKAGVDRPSEFKGGKGVVFFVLKRHKP